MKAIINGLLYDTEKANPICEPDENHTLYMTEKGNLFMLYHDSRDEIITSTANKHLKECLANKAPEKYIELFGKVKEA